MRTPISVLGIPVDVFDMEETLDRFEACIEVGRATGQHHQVATVNVDFIVNALRDPELRYLLQCVDFAPIDGMPVVWAGRLLGSQVAERVAGSDFVPALAERAARRGYSLYLLGAAPGVASQAAEVLQARYPGLRIAGVCSPPYTSVLEMDSAILDDIRAARPDILLVAFGNPKQEKWIGMYGAELGVPLMIGVGGTLDFIVGVQTRAPRWMQSTGLEWLYRLLQDPVRMGRRYGLDMFFFSTHFVRQFLLLRPFRSPAPDVRRADQGSLAVISVTGSLNSTHLPLLIEQLEQQDASPATGLCLDLSRLKRLDSAVFGVLIELAREARRSGAFFALVAVPTFLQRLFSIYKLEGFIDCYLDVARAQAAHSAHRQADTRPSISFVPPSDQDEVWAVLHAPRSLDAQTTPGFAEVCAAGLQHNVCMIVDLSNTFHLTSPALAALARLDRQARLQAGELRLAGATADVQQALRLVRFDHVIPIYASLQAALDA